MKRSPLIRRTPLRAKGPLESKTPLVARIPLRSRTAIAPVSTKRLKANRQRTVVVSAMRLAEDGRCARCSSRYKVFGHERLGRAHGGDILAPEALLCNVCNGWCEDNPIAAAWDGWKVSTKHPHDPALTIGQARDIFGNIIDFEVTRTA